MNQDLSGHDLFLQASSTWEACGNYHNLQGQEKNWALVPDADMMPMQCLSHFAGMLNTVRPARI